MLVGVADTEMAFRKKCVGEKNNRSSFYKSHLRRFRFSIQSTKKIVFRKIVFKGIVRFFFSVWVNLVCMFLYFTFRQESDYTVFEVLIVCCLGPPSGVFTYFLFAAIDNRFWITVFDGLFASMSLLCFLFFFRCVPTSLQEGLTVRPSHTCLIFEKWDDFE